MPLIKRSTIDDIKQRVNIFDVVSAYVTLKRVGSSWKGLSPFTHEKTASFFVHPEKGLFKCFSSNCAGDVFRFIQLKENVSFQEAVEILAKRFNITVEYEQSGHDNFDSAQQQSAKGDIYGLYEFAVQFFQQQFLAKNDVAESVRSYWVNERKLALKTAEAYKIGFAPVDGQVFVKQALAKGYSRQAIEQSGLFFYSSKTEQFYSRFRGRLMIPIRDIQGRPIAFSARQLFCTPKEDPSYDAKYINSPETPIFIKGNTLFNIDVARKHIQETNFFVLVEGQIDAMRCWECGILTAVAPQGTAITDQQLQLLHRYCGSVRCFLDGDGAGQKAALRALPMALKWGIEMTFLPLPEKTDPDAFLLANGKAGLDILSKNQQRPMQFATNALFSGVDSPIQKQKALQSIFEIILQCGSKVLQKDYLADVSETICVDKQALESDFLVFSQGKNRKDLAQQDYFFQKQPNSKLTSVEYQLLLLLLNYENLVKSIVTNLHPDWLSPGDLYSKLLIRALAVLHQDPDDNPDPHSLIQRIAEGEEEKNVLYLIFEEQPQFEDPKAVANLCIQAVYKNHLKERIAQIDREIASLPPGSENLKALQAERLQLRKLLHSPLPNIL